MYMKKLTSLLAFCLIVLISKSQTPTLGTLIRYVNTPIADLTEEVISIKGWELDKSEVVDSVAKLQFNHKDVCLLVKKVKGYKNELFLVCNKLKYDELNKAIQQLKPKLIDSKVNEKGLVVKTYQGEKFGYKTSIAPKSAFIVQVYDKADASLRAVLQNAPPKSGTNVDVNVQDADMSVTPMPLRNFTNLVMPQDDGEQTGKVAVRIKVDKDGNVIEATPGVKGTTLNDRELWEKCKDAAMKAKLKPSNSLASVQTGIVTFTFRIK